MFLHWRANLAEQNKQQPLTTNIRVTHHTFLSVWNNPLIDTCQHCSTNRANQTQVFKIEGFAWKRFLPSFPSPSPHFHFLVLVSFLARPKPRIPFLGISLLRNQTENLATQATANPLSSLSDTGSAVKCLWQFFFHSFVVFHQQRRVEIKRNWDIQNTNTKRAPKAWPSYVRNCCINTTSDNSKLLYVSSRAVRRVKFETILKYHKWYLCQISRTNQAIICLYNYPQRFVIFKCIYFKLSWNTTALSQSNCRNFSCSSIITEIFRAPKAEGWRHFSRVTHFHEIV